MNAAFDTATGVPVDTNSENPLTKVSDADSNHST